MGNIIDGIEFEDCPYHPQDNTPLRGVYRGYFIHLWGRNTCITPVEGVDGDLPQVSMLLDLSRSDHEETVDGQKRISSCYLVNRACIYGPDRVAIVKETIDILWAEAGWNPPTKTGIVEGRYR